MYKNTRKAAGKIFSCRYCTKVFGQTDHLEAHELLHTGEKPYSCTVCEKRFTHVSSLKQHARKHTDENPLKCDECDQSFKWPVSLRTHKAHFHSSKDEKIADTEEQTDNCDSTGKLHLGCVLTIQIICVM